MRIKTDGHDPALDLREAVLLELALFGSVLALPFRPDIYSAVVVACRDRGLVRLPRPDDRREGMPRDY